MFKLKNLVPYYLDDTTGEVKEFSNNQTKINIDGCCFSFSDDLSAKIKINCCNKIRYTSCNVKVIEKYVYLICSDNCTEETYVSLKLWQNILFKLNFINYKTIIKNIFNFVINIGKLFV